MELASIPAHHHLDYKPHKGENKYQPGAGIILFWVTPQNIIKVLLVTSKKGSIGFPKGCPEIKDTNDLRQTAIRELKEEVGIYEHQIQILDKNPYREDKIKKKFKYGKETSETYTKTNYYFVAVLKPEHYNIKLTVALEEISNAKWVTITDLNTIPLVTNASSTKGMSKCRFNMINDAYKIIKNLL